MGRVRTGSVSAATLRDKAQKRTQGKEGPRNSEGSFATLASGRVIFIYSQFYGGNGDESPARLVRIHSDDQGRTWSAPVTVVENTAATT
jgi:Neuraminidase (sialidase)